MRECRKFYLAGPLRFESNRLYLERVDAVFRSHGYETWLPHRDAGFITASQACDPELIAQVLRRNLAAFDDCDGVLFLLDGYQTGTILELGYALSLKRQHRVDLLLIGLYSDLRSTSSLDPMVAFCFEPGNIVGSLLELEELIATL